MSSWCNITVDDLGEIITGYTPPIIQTEYFGDEYPFITPTDITIDSRIVQTERFLSQKGYEYRKNRLLPRDAVCVTCIGATIGKTCMTTAPSATNQQINSIVVNQDKYDPYFVYYLLRTKTDVIQSVASGAATPIVKKSTFASINVCVPPLPTQRKIADFLDRKTGQIDELIRIKERRIELLQEQRTALINQAVTKGLDPNVEIKPSGVEWIGEIPKDWEAIPIKHTLQIAKDSIRTGPFGSSLKSHEFQDKGIRVYNQQSVYNEDFSKSDIFISEEKFNELRSYIVQPKDVLITSRGTIGKMTIVPENGEIGVLHPCLIRLRLNENKLIPKYLWWYVNHSSLFIESVKIESNATTIEVIYSEILSSVKIPIPTVREQLEILEFFHNC